MGRVQIPAAILVECVTGHPERDAELNRVLAKIAGTTGRFEPVDEAAARRAGRLRFIARTDDGIDALVAACAVGDGSPCVVLTSDPKDLRRLLAHERHVAVRRV
jgi:predicted nucleic acid-binding protein